MLLSPAFIWTPTECHPNILGGRLKVTGFSELI